MNVEIMYFWLNNLCILYILYNICLFSLVIFFSNEIIKKYISFNFEMILMILIISIISIVLN